MTIKLKKIVKYAIIFAGIILWSCEKDSAQDSNIAAAKPVNTKYLNAEELPAEFQDYFIQNNTNNSSKSSNITDLSAAIFTEHDIIRMTDDKNITNYSISFFYADTPENIFYNLVINVLPTGENSRYIFKYICNPADFPNFKAHNFDFKYFVGITEISLAPSSNAALTSKMSSGDEDCPKIYVPTPAPGDNSGTGAAGGGSGDSTGSSGYNTSVPGYNSPGHTGGSSPGPSTGGGSDGHDHSQCYGTNGQYWYFAGDVRPPHSHNEKKATDCPELVPPPGNVPVNTMPMIKVLGKELALSSNQIVFLRDKPDLMNAINQYLEENNFSEESKNFAIWSINYLMQNPNVTIDQFKNWFMGKSEGVDGTYNAAFWENPNLVVPRQNLPTLASFADALPKNSDGTYMLGADLYPHIGGDVYQAYLDFPAVVRGACALKVSRALNYAGITIGEYTDSDGKRQTLKGADGKYYFVNAKALNAWMKLTFGTNPSTNNAPSNANHRHFTGAQGGAKGVNFPFLVEGMRGIYSMVSPPAIQTSWGSGHADFIFDTKCVTGGCHFYDKDSQIVPIDFIDIWILN